MFRTHNVPLVSLDRLVFETTPALDAYTRIIVIHALGADLKLPYIGLLATQSPRPIALGRNNIAADGTAGPPVEGVLSRVQVKEQPAIIPDIAAIVTLLGPLLPLYF